MNIRRVFTDRLLLRPFREEDAQEVFECWAVVDKETDLLIGTGLVYLEEEYNLFEVGYNFGKKYWGQGYATETMQAILKYAREVLGVRELLGRYAKENPASGNVMKKLGFVYCKDIPYEANEGKTHYEVKYKL